MGGTSPLFKRFKLFKFRCGSGLSGFGSFALGSAWLLSFFMFLLFLCVLCTRIVSSLSRVVLFISCTFCVLCAWGLVELEPRGYNCGLRYPSVSCFLTTPCSIAISLTHLLNRNYDKEM